MPLWTKRRITEGSSKNMLFASYALALCVTLLLPLQAQTVSTAQQVHAFLTPRQYSLCNGQKYLDLDLLLVNDSRHDVQVETGKLSVSMAFAELRRSDGVSRAMSIIPEQTMQHASKRMTLRPSYAHRIPLRVPLT